MNALNGIHKYTVTALLAISIFAQPLAAQEVDLDVLFDDLLLADEQSAQDLADSIRDQWSRSGSAAMDLLLKRGTDALEGGAPQAAIEHFSALIDHAPDFAAGYHGRSMAFFEEGRFGPAMADIEATLRLTPRHFGAMIGLGVILETTDRPKEAMHVYISVLALDPHNEAALDAQARLEERVSGVTL